LWEIWHQHIPFDGDLALAVQYVLQEKSRPMIMADVDEEGSESACS